MTNFLKKASAAGHIETFDYKQGWRVYHLCSRSIYRLSGDPESQFRRRKGDSQVRARLMALDYVLETRPITISNPKLTAFASSSASTQSLRNLFTDDYGRLQPLLSAFPIALADRQRPAQSLVRFAFIDEGLLCIGKLVRFLGEAEALLRAIGNFEVIYVALSDFSFHAARDVFRSPLLPCFPQKCAALRG